MSLQEILAPNLNRYTAQSDSSYLSTRLLTHNGVTIAFALGKTAGGSRFFDYSILNAEEERQATGEQQQKQAPTLSEKLDSQCWFENVKTLQFPSEVRVVGEEAVPVYEIPGVDRSGRRVVRSPEQAGKLNTWLSSSLCLMDPDVVDFQVLSDGRYVYLFRQGVSAATPLPNQYMAAGAGAKPPVDGNLLCDRFSLVGGSLNQPLEARYQRSRQKLIPLNEQDTLRVRDINDRTFYEPTHSLRFVQHLSQGRFCVLRCPTVINDVFRWFMFAYSAKSGQIECLTCDVASNGLFDLHGQIYYGCDSKDHATVFATGPGSCTASKKSDGETCGLARTRIVPKTPSSNRAVQLTSEVDLRLMGGSLDLSGAAFASGFTLEGWVHPRSFWDDDDSQATGPAPGSLFCLFAQASDDCPTLFMDDELRPVLQCPAQDDVVVQSEEPVKADQWNHVAVTYDARTQTYALIVNGMAAGSASHPSKPGGLSGLGFCTTRSDSHFIGLLNEVRVWSRPLHSSTIKTRMSYRATGLESDLAACWHFDEESGTTAFDDTLNSHNLIVVVSSTVSSTKSTAEIWTRSVAPLVASYGLVRRVLRLPADIEIRGGMGACTYNEQVAVAEEKAEDEEDGGADDKGAGKETSDAEVKHMKRSARILLGFVVTSVDMTDNAGGGLLHLAMLDFALLSDGTLLDTPAIIHLPALSLLPGPSTSSSQAKGRVHTSLLYVGSQGLELFGGILALEGAECEPDAPCVFESAMGAVTIFFRARARASGSFLALHYDISRSIIAAALPPSMLGGHDGLLVTSKLRQAQRLTVQTEPCDWAPVDLAVNLTLTAQLADNRQFVETWKGMHAVPAPVWVTLRLGRLAEECYDRKPMD
jgi:hypothetical protein